MNGHPGIVNGTRIGPHVYTESFDDPKLLDHLANDQPGCVRLQLELDRVWHQTKADEVPAAFPDRIVTAWADTWALCAAHDVHVLVSLSISDNVAWRGGGYPNDPWYWPKWKKRDQGLQWASPNLSKPDYDGGPLWFADPAWLEAFLEQLASVTAAFGVTIILDGWNEADLRRKLLESGNFENWHTEYSASLSTHPLFGYTGGVARMGEYYSMMQRAFPGRVASGGMVWPAWRQTAAPHVDVQSLHVYKSSPGEALTAEPEQPHHGGGLINKVAAWDVMLGHDTAPVAVTEISTAAQSGGGGFDDRQAQDHREIISRAQAELGGRLAYYCDHTAKPNPWETDAGRWWQP